MANVIVVVPPVLRPFLGGQARVSVTATTLNEALEGLAGHSADLDRRLFDESGAINRFVRVFVDGRSLAGPGSAQQPIADGAVVTILLALAGG
jgi:molybdopterin converting factor small subunit